MAMADNTRKRKQEFVEPKPINTSWSDFVYSSPNSPQQQQAQDFSLDSIFHHHYQPAAATITEQQQHQQQQQQQQQQHRRHSVAVGEMQYNSIENKMNYWSNNQEFEQLINNTGQHSLPSSWSSSSSVTVDGPMMHRRAMSLRLDNLPIHHHHVPLPQEDIHHRNNSISTASPTTPAFFSPSFLDALKHDEDHNNNQTYSDDIIHDFMLNQQQQQQQQQSTITPSVINGNDLTNWLLNQPVSPSSTSSHSPTNNNHTFQQQHPSIPEEEDDHIIKEEDDHIIKEEELELDQDRMICTVIKPLVQKYLFTFENEKTITILTSKVAQKSYGTEKRFLCPPPSTLLSGTSWFTNDKKQPSLVVNISGEKTNQNGVIEWVDSTTGTLLDHSLVGDTTNLSGNCVSKHLHINDADEKRKRVEVLVKFNLGNGLHLGTFASKGIKVISKPSKKRQSVKNMELCIHHGTTISLFNRIRSQTVSTKYLGVSTGKDKNGTCFVARTNSWDPFVIWIVDTNRSPDSTVRQHHQHLPENAHFPPPPAIALHTTAGQPIALHYNQPVVLQCVSTGLVSPVMVIRKVDKGSMIMGGNRLFDLSGPTGGECGDEALGDPVSQLHKIAFQIVQDPSIAHNNKATHHFQPTNNNLSTEFILPQTSQAVSYLACLSDVVGMHKTTAERTFILPSPPSQPQQPQQQSQQQQQQQQQQQVNRSIMTPNVGVDPFGWQDNSYYDLSVISQQENGKVTRKRRVSCDVNSNKPMSLPKYPTPSISATQQKNRRRVNSLNDGLFIPIKQESGAGRRGSTCSSDQNSSIVNSDNNNGACWTEDVSDASVWTIVGTDSTTFKFWTPPSFKGPITPFPVLSKHQVYTKRCQVLNLVGEHFSREIMVWFGDIKSPRTDYKSKESIACTVPDIQDLNASSTVIMETEGNSRKIPLLFVRSDGVIYNTDMFYTF